MVQPMSIEAGALGAPPAVPRQLPAWQRNHESLLRSLRTGHPSSLEAEVDADRELLRVLYEDGISRRGWPESAGGSGGDETDRARMYDEIAQADLRIPEAFVLLETLGPVLVEYAPELAAQHLPAYLRGEQLWGQGFSEPEAGSDLASVRTRGIVDGDRIRIDGQKTWTTLGQCARWAMVLCRTDADVPPHRGLSMVWIDLTAPGAETRPIEASNGRHEFAEMFFVDVEAPLSAVVGGLGNGWAVAMYLLQFERGMYAWGRQASLHRALRRGVAAATEITEEAREATGIAFASLCALRSRSAQTVGLLAAKQTLGPEASIDKVLLSRCEQQTYDALRLLAGAAFTLDHDPASRALRDEWFYSRATSIFGGAVEIQRSIIAERIVGLPREPRRG
jgi:acyl-CoA dehydrogenase